MTNWRRINCQGSVYVLSLVSILVMVALLLGLTQRLMKQRLQTRVGERVEKTQIAAELGIRHALWFTRQSPYWRGLVSNGVWLNTITVGNCVYSVWGEDPADGNLNNDQGTPVKITCSATAGDVKRAVSVTMKQNPLPILKYALAAGSIEMYASMSVTGNVTSNYVIYRASTAVITGNADSVNWISSKTNISGAKNEYQPMKLMPDETTIMNYYISRATAINYYAIASASINEKLLTPGYNPWGAANAEGLYYINCNGNALDIRDSRILGTLIIDNVNDLTINSSILLQSYRADYPALVVDGDLIYQVYQVLSEAREWVDLSRPGESGFGTKTNIWTSAIKGLVYVTDDVNLDNIALIQGALFVGDQFKGYQSSQITYDSALYTTPPKCFEEFFLSPVEGTWQDIVK